MTTEWESRLWTALRALEEAATPARAGGRAGDLKSAIAELGRLSAGRPPDTDPELAHFLNRRSYEKARLWLEDRRAAIERGGCSRSR